MIYQPAVMHPLQPQHVEIRVIRDAGQMAVGDEEIVDQAVFPHVHQWHFQTEASHQAFRAKYGLNFDLVSDPSHTTMAAYGAYGEKLNYGKTIVGVIRSTFVVGPTGTIEQAWYGVKTDGHAARVLKSLQR